MLVKDIVGKLNNGSCHILLFDYRGVVLLRTIWHNAIPEELLNKEVDKIFVLDYELRIGLKNE